LVWWDGLSAAMASYPKMYRVWLTKHVSKFCGNNVQFYYWSKGLHSPKCKFCLVNDEYTSHIGRCRDPGRDIMFRISARKIYDWMVTTIGDTAIATTVEEYLLSRGEITMETVLTCYTPEMLLVAKNTDRLGWDCLVEGRICTHWLAAVAPYLAQTSPRTLVKLWGWKFITKLHELIHSQWVYQNSMIHFKGTEGFTLPEQHEIFNRMEECALIDPDTLLPRHRYLSGIDFASLGSSPTSHCLLWMAEMEAAVSVSWLNQCGSLTPEALAYFKKET
jgi:hypothetical protein